MPAQRIAILLGFLIGHATSMRKRAGTVLFQEVKSQGQVASSSPEAQCFWNNFTARCTAFAWVRPQGTSSSVCEPENFDYPGWYQEQNPSLTESECNSRIGIHGPCLWWSKRAYEDKASCLEPVCDNMPDEESCRGQRSLHFRCAWTSYGGTLGSCRPLSCWDHKNESECNAGPCRWRGDSCQDETSCHDFNDRVSCATGFSSTTSAMLEREQSVNQKHEKSFCYWAEADEYSDRGHCSQFVSCGSFDSMAKCNNQTDARIRERCEWNTRRGECAEMVSCSNYESEQSCEADRFGLGEKVYPGTGTKCRWSPGPQITVGETLAMSESVGKLNTSSRLEIKASHEVGVLNPGTTTNDDWILRMTLKGGETWRPEVPVQEVVNSDGQTVNWSDVPTPIPDGWKLLFAKCHDSLPPMKSQKFMQSDLMGACSHHDSSTCATATTLFTCPQYCGWASCWMAKCSERCPSSCA